MTLLHPAALAFLALVPLIVVLYLLKLRRQPARVSTLMFWQRVAADNRRRALFQRLRQLLSLLLHLLIFGLLLLALARPELRAFRGAEAGLSTVVVLDARARMQARTGRNGGGETRFDQARRIAEGFLRRASPRQPVALLVAETSPRVLVGLTGEERPLLDGLDGVRPTDAGGRIEDAVDLARGLLASRAGGRRVVVVTDRVPANAAGSPEVETRLVPAAGAGPRENVGLTRLTARALPNSPETDEVLVEVANFGARRQAGSVELSFEGRLFDVKPFDLAPGERRVDVYPALAARTGIANPRGWLTAHLALAPDAADAYAPDDDAYAVIPPPRPARVLLVTNGNWFLENLLKADDRVRFELLAPDGFQPAQAAGFDAVILDGFLPAGIDPGHDPARLPPGNFLFIGRLPFGPGTEPGKRPAALEHPIITDVDASSPLLRLVDLRDATILRAEDWTLPEPAADAGGDPWRFAAPVRSFEHPLVLTGERRGQRLAALAFGVADSDLPLRVAFPLFMQNTLQWLTGRDGAPEADATVRAGETITLARGDTLWTRLQRAYAPINGPIPAAERLDGPAVFQPVRAGFYLVRGADGADRWLAVDTLDAAQSALNGPAAPAGDAAPADRPALAGALGGWWESARVWPPWVYLAGMAFVLCTLEWWGFHRRRTE